MLIRSNQIKKKIIMRSEEICFMSACEMVEKIKTQELTSLEITETLIERIEKINPIINSYCTPTFDISREMAKKADLAVKKNEKLGLLHGVPTSIKDLTLTKGIKTTFGSKIYENFIPDEDEIVVQRLKKEGIVILGKTNTPEFGHAGSTHNPVFGETKNPWNLERTSGGSSGGAASGTAAGLSILALGSDGGGSIRIPCCLCGVYGIKPNFGRVPIYPTFAYGAPSVLACKGPIVRYVKDAALMLDAIKGPHDADPFSLPSQDLSYYEKIEQKPTRLKIGYSLDLGFAKAVDSEIEQNIVDSVQKFEKLGWSVEKVKLKIKKPDTAFSILFTSGYAYDLKSKLKEWGDKMEPDLVKMVDAGLSYSGYDLMRSLDQKHKLYLEIHKHFENYDILITPTCAVTAFKLGIMGPTEISGKNVSPTAWIAFTFPFNLTGHPAASIPSGFSSEGLPIGMQIVGNRFNELLVLQVSKAFEEISPWQDKKPQLSNL